MNTPKKIDEDKLRDDSKVLESIGPENDTAEETLDELEAYGYEQMSEDDFESPVTGESDQPETWMSAEALEQADVPSIEAKDENNL